MKKTYKYTLPKGMEMKKTNVRVENGQILVDVELKETFDPKDGDFLITKQGNIFIYNGKQSKISYGAYAGVRTSQNIVFGMSDNGWTLKKGCRYATPEEKSAFLERLEKELHKRWNPDKKCLEDIYVPKFGDIVRIDHPDAHKFKRQYVISIFPNKEVPNNFVNDFFDICVVNMDGDLSLERHSSYNYGFVSPASESEKQELFDKLAEVGKRWNPDTKQLEDIQWRADKGEEYYYIYINDFVKIYESTENNDSVDKDRYKANNYFRTPASAQKVADQIKEIFKNSKRNNHGS